MATVYLCIGTQKTGTTSLQYFMRANEGVLKEQGYSYPYMDIGIPDAYYKNRMPSSLPKNSLAAFALLSSYSLRNSTCS